MPWTTENNETVVVAANSSNNNKQTQLYLVAKVTRNTYDNMIWIEL